MPICWVPVRYPKWAALPSSVTIPLITMGVAVYTTAQAVPSSTPMPTRGVQPPPTSEAPAAAAA